MLRRLPPFSFFCLLLLAALPLSAEEIQPVKYVFLFIGDGMSLPQRQMAEEFAQKTENRGLTINAMPYQAITATHAAGDQFITDSAAAGTAIACGEKTKNGTLGQDTNGKRLQSVAELALQNGRRVGIITSVTINHATPAAFYAHVDSRGSGYDIGLDMLASGFHYFGGGGVSMHDDKTAKQYRGSIYDLAQEAGYTVCRSAEKIKALQPGSGKVMAFGSDTELPYAIDGNKTGLRLADFTRQAIKLLDNPKGFFLMVEGGKIDYACHSNDAASAVRETLEFDDAVSEAFLFAEKKPSDVLIMVTGDHETGALIVKGANTGNAVHLALLQHQKASQGALVTYTEKWMRDNKEEATFEQFKSVITDKCGLIFSESGQWKAGNLNLTKSEMKELENDFAESKKAILEKLSTGKDKVVRTMIRLLNSKAGITWSSTGHSALPVNTSLWGSRAAQMAPVIRDNTDIGKQLKLSVGTLP